jgi:uncharacterized Zn finger protein
MTCPACGCKETYVYDQDETGDEDTYRCAACGSIFDWDYELPEEDDLADVDS